MSHILSLTITSKPIKTLGDLIQVLKKFDYSKLFKVSSSEYCFVLSLKKKDRGLISVFVCSLIQDMSSLAGTSLLLLMTFDCSDKRLWLDKEFV